MATKNQLDETFKSVDGQSELPEPSIQGSAKRPADKTTGETEYSQTTKSEVLAKLMQDLQSRSADEVLNVYKAVSSTNDSVNRRPADKNINGGETYGTTTHAPTAVKPVIARENVEEIFAGEDLSEELMDRAAVVYEAAVNQRIAIIEARLEEQYAETLEEAIDLVHDEMVESIDKYMTYVANQWMEENLLAVDNGLKAEMAEEFLLGLKDLFEANYVTVSDDREDVLSSMAEEIGDLKTRLNEEVEKNISLSEEVEETRIGEIVSEMVEGMALSQKEKFISLAESISYVDADDFVSKAETIKETYFSEKKTNTNAQPLTEDFYAEENEAAEVPSNMRVYADHLARLSKK